KVLAEKTLIENFSDCIPILIPRLRFPISRASNQRNLINKIVGYSTVVETLNSVTIVEDFLYALHLLIQQEVEGIVHIVNPGPITHRRILEMYKEIVDPTFTMPRFVSVEEFEKSGLTKDRRSNCIL